MTIFSRNKIPFLPQNHQMIERHATKRTILILFKPLFDAFIAERMTACISFGSNFDLIQTNWAIFVYLIVIRFLHIWFNCLAAFWVRILSTKYFVTHLFDIVLTLECYIEDSVKNLILNIFSGQFMARAVAMIQGFENLKYFCLKTIVARANYFQNLQFFNNNYYN
jgi:hypothetical protein